LHRNGASGIALRKLEECRSKPGAATALDSFVDISAGRIIGGEIVFERFRFVADGAACVGHSEDSEIE
jgi:hypothetical protein